MAVVTNGISSAEPAGAAQGGVLLALRMEGLAVALGAVWIYGQTGVGWGVFALCLLLPDLAMLGYLAGNRVGAVCYNLAHSYGAPLALLVLGGAEGWAVAAASLWVAHIGIDRALGYGMKYAAGFRSTHLG